jgi:hypothetical protein
MSQKSRGKTRRGAIVYLGLTFSVAESGGAAMRPGALIR